jgi:hypothetical protein
VKAKKDALRVNFDRKLKFECHAVKVTRDVPQKTEIFIVQVEFGKIISIERVE